MLQACPEHLHYCEGFRKKLRTSKAIFHGRKLEAMAKKGLIKHRKHLCFTKDRWYLKKHEPKDSGTTTDDVIDCVRLKIQKRSI